VSYAIAGVEEATLQEIDRLLRGGTDLQGGDPRLRLHRGAQAQDDSVVAMNYLSDGVIPHLRYHPSGPRVVFQSAHRSDDPLHHEVGVVS